MGKDGLVEVEVDKNWSNLPVSELRKPTGDAYWDEYAARINGLDGYNMPVSSFVKNGVLDGTMQNNIAFKENVQLPLMFLNGIRTTVSSVDSAPSFARMLQSVSLR